MTASYTDAVLNNNFGSWHKFNYKIFILNSSLLVSSASNTPKRPRSSPSPQKGKKMKKSASVNSSDAEDVTTHQKLKSKKRVLSSDEDN